MLRTKKDVDRHVLELLKKAHNENEVRWLFAQQQLPAVGRLSRPPPCCGVVYCRLAAFLDMVVYG